MGTSLYSCAWPLLRATPPEFAHRLGLLALRAPLRLGGPPVSDPFEWRGLTFRNRAGIAAGLDKDACCLAGLERLGAGFVEIGTILDRPWDGAPVRPRMKRLLDQDGIWNRLGFPSDGVERVARRLAAFPAARRRGMVVACNVGPHPATVRSIGETAATAGGDASFLRAAREELVGLARALEEHAELFVLNLSSPNTPGLRTLLYGAGFARELVRPLRDALGQAAEAARRPAPRPLLVKLPPEDAEGQPWTRETLARVVEPLIEARACDGFVAVNTSTRLARERVPEAGVEYPGGISGAPLFDLAREGVRLVRELAEEDQLVIGVGGITEPEQARELVGAGAHLVELYSGLIYRGPGLVGAAAAALAAAAP